MARYIQDPVTLELVPASEYVSPGVKTHDVFCNQWDTITSPITGEVLSSKRRWEDDLKRHGCRPYEGRDEELKEGRRRIAYAEEAEGRCIERTAADVFANMSEAKRRALKRHFRD